MDTKEHTDMSSKKYAAFSFRNILTTITFVTAGTYVIPPFLNIAEGLYRQFPSSSVTFNQDTLYLNWNTSFPAVTVCELYNGERVWDISEEYFGSNRSSQLDNYLGEVLFFRGTCMSCRNCDFMECPTDFQRLMSIFRTNCSELFDNCSWDGNDFDCCSEFLPINTEYGVCYSFNSNHARKARKAKFFSNRETGPGYLNFFVTKDVQVHIHPPMEIPIVSSDGVFRETIFWGTYQEIIFNVIEIYNDPSVLLLSPEQRRCQFSNELQNNFELYHYYSFSTCEVECMRNLKLYACNCTDHNLAREYNDDQICDDIGLSCLTEFYDIVRERRKDCNCLNTCEEPQYDIIYNSADWNSGNDLVISKISIMMLDLPTRRFVRIVSKNNLDLLISAGGIVGLFFGASLIKIFEIFAFGIRHLRLYVFGQKVKGK